MHAVRLHKLSGWLMDLSALMRPLCNILTTCVASRWLQHSYGSRPMHCRRGAQPSTHLEGSASCGGRAPARRGSGPPQRWLPAVRRHGSVSIPLPQCLGAVSSQRQSGKASVSHMMCGKLPSVCRRGAAPKMQRRLADQVPHTATRSRTAQVCMNGPWTAGPRGQERAGITTKGKRELRARAHLAQQVLVWMLQVEP